LQISELYKCNCLRYPLTLDTNFTEIIQKMNIITAVHQQRTILQNQRHRNSCNDCLNAICWPFGAELTTCEALWQR